MVGRLSIAFKRYRHISIYFFCYFFNAAVSFAVVSLLTHHLTPQDYGIVNLYSVLLALLLPFLSGGILQTLNVEFFKREKQNFAGFFSAALLIPLTGTVFFTLVALLFTGSISNILKVPPIYVWIIPVLVLCVFFQEVIMALSRNKNQPNVFAVFSIGKNLLEGLFSLMFVISLHQAFEGRLNALAVSSLVTLGAILITLWKWGYFTSFKGITLSKQILIVSAPLMIERISVFVISSSDRYFINSFAKGGTAEVGLYGVGAQIATIANLTLLSMNNFFVPYIFRTIKNKREGQNANVRKAILVYAGVSTLAIVAVLAATPFIFSWFIGPAFQSGQTYALLLTAAYLPWALYQALVPILLFEQENRFIMLIAVTAIVVSLGANFILVPLIGARGAVLTLLLVNTIMALMTFVKIKRKYSSLF